MVCYNRFVMKNERQEENMGTSVEFMGKGKVVVRRGDTKIILEETAAPRNKPEKRKIPTTDLLILAPTIRLAFPEQGMGVGEAERFVPLEKGSMEEISSSCARLAKKGWSSHDAAEHIIQQIPEVKAALNLGSATEDEISGAVDRFSSFLSSYYPGNQTKGRRLKVVY